MTPDAQPFSAQQQAILDLPVAERAVVDAAAGTGKTHVLAGRLTTLVERDGLSVGDELLVLSFSRAAVAELRRRVGGLGGDARYVGAATFDSFASQILATEDPLGGWTELGYDDRIMAAIQILEGSDVPQVLRLVRHVLIDELQDVVGPRAELVTRLLEVLNAGFTLFGDPAQAIYGHEVDDRSDGDSIDLYRSIERVHGPSRYSLTEDFRSRVPQKKEVARAGQLLRDGAPIKEAASAVRSVLLQIPTTTVLGARRLLTSGSSKCALLTRNNAEALRLSEELHARSVPHRYQRRGQDRAAAAWIGRALAHVDQRQLSSPEFAELVEPFDGPDPDIAWMSLAKLSPSRTPTIDLVAVADHLRFGTFPEELNEAGSETVAVSTIHRAKGLEFDHVLIAETIEREGSDTALEARVQYVALSRARESLFHLPPVDTTGLGIDGRTGRWVKRGFGAKRWRIDEIEVRGNDVDASAPPGAWPDSADVRGLQSYLGSCVDAGDPVELFLSDRTYDDGSWVYVIVHCDRVIGATSERFGMELRWVFGERRPPTRFHGLHVETVDSVAGSGHDGRSHGLGPHGIWLRPRVYGLGRVVFAPTRQEQT